MLFSNLLKTAMRIVPTDGTVQYLRYVSDTTDDAGYETQAFADPVPVTQSSVQAVPQSRYEYLGLDYTREYVTWFAPFQVRGLSENYAGDRIKWRGSDWQIDRVTAWSGEDGWTEALCYRMN